MPDEITKKLAGINNVLLNNFIFKKADIKSKNVVTITNQSFDRYNVNLDNLDRKAAFLVIDDVVGTGATLCEVMYKLFNFNKKINYFLAIVKDVRR